MGAKKKQKLMVAAQEELNAGLQSILSDTSLSLYDRAAAAGRALRQPGLPAAVHRSVLDWLMQREDAAAAPVLAGCLSAVGVQAVVAEEPGMLDRLLPAAAEAAAAAVGGAGAERAGTGDGVGGGGASDVSYGGVSALNLSSFPADRLIGPAAAAASLALSTSSTSADSPDSLHDSRDSVDPPAGGPLFRGLCERLSTVTDPPESLRAAYLAELLIPSLRLARARPEFCVAIRGPFQAVALAPQGLSVAAGVVEEGQGASEEPARQELLLNALQNLSATEPSLGAELLALLAGSCLRRKTPLHDITLLAKCVGICTTTLQESPTKPAEANSNSTAAELPLSTRLLLLGRLARCIREARLPLTSSAGGQTLLQWLRTIAASAGGGLSAAAEWYECAAELMRVSPLVLPLQGRLGPVLVQAIRDCHGTDGAAASAASRLITLTITTYSELRQLPRLLPQLLLSARHLSGRADQSRQTPERQDGQRLTLTPAQEQLLAGRLARLPQPHVADVWKTLLYHLGEDGVEAMRRGDEPTDSISAVLELTLQLVACFLHNTAVVDQTTITAATRALLPALMTQTSQTLQQMAALVTRTYQSADHLCGLLSASLAWRRLHSALLQYCPTYRADVTSSDDAGMTAPMAPLSDKRWGKLTRLEAAVEAGCSQLMAEVLSEASRVAPPGWQRPAGPAGAEDPARPLTGAALAPLSPVQLGRLLPSGAECRPLPLAVTVLLAERLAAMPSVGGKRKLDCGRPPLQLAVVLRDAAAAALKEDDADMPVAPPLPEEVWEILEEVGACLESAAGHTASSERVAEAKDRAAESLTRPLKFVHALPLEHLSEPAASLLLPALCLCLLHTLPGGGERRLTLSALTALLVSTGCRRPLEKIKPERLLMWLASAPPALSNGSATLSTKDKSGTRMQNGINSEDDETSPVLNGSRNPDRTPLKSPKTRTSSITSSPHRPSPDASNADNVASEQDGAVASEHGTGGLVSPDSAVCPVWAARVALLRCYPGRRAVQLGPAAERLVALQQGGGEGRHGVMDTLLELLQHFVQTNTALKGSDTTLKQQAKSLSTSLPRLLSDLPSTCLRRTLSALALLVPLRAHKPSGSGRTPRWRRLLTEAFPAALEAARAEQGSRERGTEEQAEREAAWRLLTAVCTARGHLKGDLPPSYVMDVWRCARSSDVTTDQLRAVLTVADDAEMEHMVTELTDETMSEPVSASVCGRLLVGWRALAGCVAPSAGAQQRRGLSRLLDRLSALLSQLTANEEGRGLLVMAIETATAAVAQRHVRLSDAAYSASVQCCHLELTSVTTRSACEVLQAACDLLCQLVSTHPGVVSTRLPLITQAVQSLAEEVCTRSTQEPQPTPEEQAALVATANRINRVVRELVQLGPLFGPLAPYLIADLLTLIQRAPLDADLQEAITASLFCLLTQCRDEVITRLRVTLSPTVTHLFHTTLNTYKRFHKFVGRV